MRKAVLIIISALSISVSLLLGKYTGFTETASYLMILAALVSGSDIALRAWRNLLNRHISIELLVSIAAVGALFIGEYWESAAVTFLFLLGAWLETRTIGKTRKLLGDLLDLVPAKALVLRDGEQIEILPAQLNADDTVIVKPGMKIPVDGIVSNGHSAVNESCITGESLPVEKSAGDSVYAGTVNESGMMQIEITGIGEDTTLARIIRRVEEAQDEKAPTQRFIEKFAKWYTPFIIGLSVLTYAFSRNIELSLTLLVIGCPGALVISTPISIISGIGRSARGGILIKGGEYLENAGKISALALDKTGTLTVGRPSLTEVILPEENLISGKDNEGCWSAKQKEVINWAALAESGSEHPLAMAVMKEADANPVPDSVSARPGQGIIASHENNLIHVGTESLLRENGIDISPAVLQRMTELKQKGRTGIYVSVNGSVSGLLGIADTIRDDSAEMVRALRKNGLKRIIMLTGDSHETAAAIAEEAGIEDFRANLLPEDKLNAIKALKKEGHVVAMVGDGINDAPSLAASDIGIAMGAAGTDVAIETADIALLKDNLMKIPEAIKISRGTVNNIRQNMTIALLTVAFLLTGVFLGEVHMAGGMLIHEASVLLVTLNGIRLIRI